ncbi:MAG: phosphoribosylglycinamide formyltransferase [Cyanobacteria bacterium P01_D01_bin.105]
MDAKACVSPALISPAAPGVSLDASQETATARLSEQLPGNPPRQPCRIGVMASGSGSNFEAIANAISQGNLHAELGLLIYNNPGAKVADRARRLGVPTVLLDHRTFESREALDDAIVSALQDAKVDWVVMAGWMRRVTQRLISAFPNRILNIHPSLLPSFPGVKAVDQALAAGVKIAGCSVHYVELVVDSGPIVMQAAVPVLPDDTLDSLQARIQVQEHRIFPMAIAIAIGQRVESSNYP